MSDETSVGPVGSYRTRHQRRVCLVENIDNHLSCLQLLAGFKGYFSTFLVSSLQIQYAVNISSDFSSLEQVQLEI